MVKTSKGDTYFKTEVISDHQNENGIPIRIHQVQPLGIRNQFLTYSFNNVIVETPITDQFESLDTDLPDHISDNDYRNSTQNPADYDYWNSPNENHDLSEPDWIREQRELAEFSESIDRQRLEEFGDIQDIQPSGTINVYWGQAESNTSTRILSNLAPRRFTFKGREYGSVEHAYQSNKSGTFDEATYNAYNKIGGYGKKIRGKGTVAEMRAANNLELMKHLVVESFKQNPNSEAAKKLMQYENFTHNTNTVIDKAFLEGLKLAQTELLQNNSLGEIVSETSLFGQESNLSEKNIFTVEPIQSVDKKAKSKAKIATQYIGFAEGIAGSSTALYAKQAGKYANTGNYSSNDVIFVSIGGRRGNEVVRKQQQDKTIREAVKALDAGATLITDNASYVESNSYNEGEKRLAANLKDRGYNYSETTVDGDLLGVWSKNTNQITPQQEQQAQPSSDNYIIEQVGKEKINEYKNKCK